MIKSYKGSETHVVIPSLIGKRRVSVLADRAFYPWEEANYDNNEALCAIGTIELPLGMEMIGDQAFGSMGSLKKVSLPSTLTSIGEAAFACCVNLEEIVIPESVTEIGESAFALCRALKKVVAPQGLKKRKKFIFGDDVDADFEWV